MEQVLVAGATGYLGRFVARAMKQQGYRVKVLVRSDRSLDATGAFDSPAIREWVDEVVIGDITKPETLEGVCTQVDYVFSSIGITRQKDKVTFMDVDYQGNVNLLREAERAQVKRFMYINAHASEDCPSAMIQAKKHFVEELKKSKLSYIVVNPTGFFSDMGIFMDMAKSGRVFLFGSGENTMNPIHGSDLANFCASSWEESRVVLTIGGPKAYSYRGMSELALDISKQKHRIYSLPVWVMKLIFPFLKLFNRRQYDLFQFFFYVMTHDAVAKPIGCYELPAYFKHLHSDGQ